MNTIQTYKSRGAVSYPPVQAYKLPCRHILVFLEDDSSGRSLTDRWVGQRGDYLVRPMRGSLGTTSRDLLCYERSRFELGWNKSRDSEQSEAGIEIFQPYFAISGDAEASCWSYKLQAHIMIIHESATHALTAWEGIAGDYLIAGREGLSIVPSNVFRSRWSHIDLQTNRSETVGRHNGQEAGVSRELNSPVVLDRRRSPQLVNAYMIALARQSRGFTQPDFAERIGASQSYIAKLEMGSLRLLADKPVLRMCAETLHYPESFFLHWDVEGESYMSRDIYVGRGKSKAANIKQLNTLRARVEMRLRHIAELRHGSALTIPTINGRTWSKDPYEAARQLREQVGIEPGPIPDVTCILEQFGIVVAPFDFEATNPAAILGVVNGHTSVRVAFVNSRCNSVDRRYALATVLGNFVLDAALGGSCQLSEQNAEHYVDSFTKALLLSEEKFCKSLAGITVGQVAALRAQWGVPIEAMMERAVELQAIPPRKASDWRLHFQRLDKWHVLDTSSGTRLLSDGRFQDTPHLLQDLVVDLIRRCNGEQPAAATLNLLLGEFRTMYAPGDTSRFIRREEVS